LEDLLHQRIFQIGLGYEDANDCHALRRDPAFTAACERLPIVGEDLASPPTMSRWEHAPRRSAVYRMAQARLDTFVAAYDRAPKAILLDRDDPADEVHGAQQQSLFNGYYDAYCSLPLHIYEGQSGTLMPAILRPGRRLTGEEIVSMLKRVVGAMRRAWPEVAIILRGDGPFSTPEVPQWWERQEPAICYLLGQGGNAVLKRAALRVVDQARSLYRSKQQRASRQQAQAHRKQQKSTSKKGTPTSQNR